MAKKKKTFGDLKPGDIVWKTHNLEIPRSCVFNGIIINNSYSEIVIDGQSIAIKKEDITSWVVNNYVFVNKSDAFKKYEKHLIGKQNELKEKRNQINSEIKNLFSLMIACKNDILDAQMEEV